VAVFQSSSRTPSLGDIVRRFGVEPDSIRLIQRRHNTHWRVRAGSDRYVLRRFGAWSFTDGDIDWELAAIEAMAGCGLPVARQLGEPLNICGATYILMPWLAGRRLAPTPTSEADYRRLGALLAQVHAATQGLEPPGQRPGWGAYVDGALPLAGGAMRRAQLLDDLAKVDADMARRFAEAAEALDARNLPAAFAREPRMIVHADFQPWNLRMRHGRLSGLLDFELAHLDVRAADVAMARRGYHDAVVEGYLEHATLSAAELGLLDALWLAAVLSGVWRVLEGPEGATGKHRLDWNLEQLGKTKPFRA
jgi:Ser/Thr protein kinase RdoA (MazF antagonist)